MCGIVGWSGMALPRDAALRTLQAMRGTIVHRGPDDHGDFVAEDAALGMQRLSIVDLGGGHQPMASDDGAIQVVFNGEIYNHDALRRSLQGRGAGFRTRSDTEVVLRTFELEGLDGFRAFNGMFAIAVWDGRERRLSLVRDRLGVKPLYYAPTKGGIVFASEIKAILASGFIGGEVNHRALWDYLTLRYVPAPETIWKDVFKLPPGHRLTFEPGRPPQLERWWDVPRQPFAGKSDSDLLEEFTALFESAVHLRMVADVPVGIMLSGGLDSSAVAAAAVARQAAPVETFSVAFADSPETDERRYAQMVARHLNTSHHEVVIGCKDFIDFLPELVHFTDEPLADLASVPLYYVSRLARQTVKVALSGEGSDEIFGGYTFDRWAARWDEAAAPAHRLRRWLGQLGGGARHAPASETDLRRLPVPLVMTDYATGEEKRAWMKDDARYPDSHDGARAALARLGQQPPLNQALYVYCQDWLVEDLLMKADKMSMAASLELRTPFLDFRLVEWAWTLPPRLKVGRDGAGGDYATKLILRRYAQSRLPAAIIDRPKQGFPVPVYGWLSDVLAGWAAEILGRSAKVRSWLHDDAVDMMVRQGTAENADTMARHRLWNLLILEFWFRRWRP